MSAPASPVAAAGPPFDTRLAVGLLGALLAAMMAGLSGRVPALVLTDMQGGLGISADAATWLSTAYSAGELAAMPFAAWFAITFSMRRFYVVMLAAASVLAAAQPFARDLDLLIGLRMLHGLCAGSLVPILMMAALRFLPAHIRLHGLALFAMTATLSPNLALWFAAFAADRLEDWRWGFWLNIPLALLAMAMVAWGIPKMPPALARFRQGNWFGMALALPGLMLLVAGIDQGVRLDWFNSALITASLLVGVLFVGLYLFSEWLHPAPFVRLDLFKRRNIWLNGLCLGGLLVTMLSAVGLPAQLMGGLHDFRMAQSASLGLVMSLPQLFLGSCVALLLYQRWADARHTFALGFACIAAACWLNAGITDEWMVEQFLPGTLLHVIGQPLAMVSMLFLIVGAVQPAEGPFLAGLINIVRVISSILGGAFIGQLNFDRSSFHFERLRDQSAHMMASWAGFDTPSAELLASIGRQAGVLAAADVYRVIGVLALLLIPAVLKLTHVPAPRLPSPPPAAPKAAGASS